MSERVEVAIVPHTHWDREWYAAFQTYRLKLVRLLDGLLPALETDEGFAHFCLDGQTAVLDDYLQIRPAAEERLRRLAQTGRISIGPWAILMDEFMVSGETIVRNLQAGRRRARELGATMPVGYLPDMFGHIAQMPQLLRLAGLDHTVVWRGVPSEVADRTAFWWEAPDGSRIRAEYLYGSYSNGRDLPPDGAALVQRAADYDAEVGDARLPGGGLLLMNGTDHHLPQPWVSQAVAEANAMQERYRFTVTSLAEYLKGQPSDGLATWRGELRSGARSNLLMGVVSNRVDIRRAMAAAEQALERKAEPLLALFRPASEWAASAALLDVAWSRLILNSAHDSSCACSHDEVVDQVDVRYREARQIAEGLAAEAMAALAAEVEGEAGDVLVVNTTSRARGGLVELSVPGADAVHVVTPDGEAHPAQTVGVLEQELFRATVTGPRIAWILDMMRGREFAGRLIRSWEWEGDDLTLRVAWPGDPGVDLGALREELAARIPEGATITVASVEGPLQQIVTGTGPVDGFGWTVLSLRPGAAAATAGAVVAGERDGKPFAANADVRVEVDPDDGTLTLESAGLRVSGLNRYVDGGDGGDTYNYSPPAADRLVDRPGSVSVEVLEAGPVRARLAVDAVYSWPTHAEGDERCCSARAAREVDVHVRTLVEVRAGDPVVGVTVEVDNTCRDHRLRAHFPLPAPVAGSDAGCAFAVVHRGLEAEGGPGEAALPTFPARPFVDCSDGSAGLAVISEGLCEYEVTGEGTELAVTVLRATGYLSRLQPGLRPNAAGPPVPVEGAQLQGRQIRRYGLFLHQGGWQAAGLHARSDAFLVPLEWARLTGAPANPRPATGHAVRVTGAEVSAAGRDGEAVILRLYNPSPEPVTATIERPDGAAAHGHVVDFDGDPISRIEGHVPLRAGEIVTIGLDGGMF
jgi:alpha-mannosidase